MTISNKTLCFLSPCGNHRYFLRRILKRNAELPFRIAFIGVNPSRADQVAVDLTDKKWCVFGQMNGATEVVYGNLFTFRSPYVSVLSTWVEVNGPNADMWLRDIIETSDIVVPCWGSRDKIPKELHYRIGEVLGMIRSIRAPVKIFGLTKSGDPKHVGRLPYSTKLIDWSPQ